MDSLCICPLIPSKSKQCKNAIKYMMENSILRNSGPIKVHWLIDNAQEIYILYDSEQLIAKGYTLVHREELNNVRYAYINEFEIFKPFRKKGYGIKFYRLIQEQFKDDEVVMTEITDELAYFWYKALGFKGIYHEATKIAANYSLKSEDKYRRICNIGYYCGAQYHRHKVNEILERIEKLSQSGKNASEIERLINISNMKIAEIVTGPLSDWYLAIPGNIPIYDQDDVSLQYAVGRYIVRSDSLYKDKFTAYGFDHLLSEEDIRKWNTEIILSEKDYQIIPEGETIIYTVHKEGGKYYFIGCLEKDIWTKNNLCISNIPIFNISYSQLLYSNIQDVPKTRKGIIQFDIGDVGSEPSKLVIIPIVHPYFEYINSDYTSICSIETYGPINMPKFDTYIDAIIFMLKTRSTCPIFDKKYYIDVIVQTC